MTRGNLTTFSIANDVAKYFAIIPAALISLYPQLEALNVMHLASPYSAIISAVIFNALIIPVLIPLALKSAGSNLAPTHPELIQQTKERVARLRDTGVIGEIPADLVCASASGLDPHISPEAAWLQAPRIAGGRGLTVEKVHLLVVTMMEGPQAGTLGAPRVNVLALNMALDKGSVLP